MAKKFNYFHKNIFVRRNERIFCVSLLISFLLLAGAEKVSDGSSKKNRLSIYVFPIFSCNFIFLMLMLVVLCVSYEKFSFIFFLLLYQGRVPMMFLRHSYSYLQKKKKLRKCNYNFSIK